MKLYFRSLRKNLVLIVLLSTLAALVASLGTIIAYDLRSYHQTLIADLTTQAELLGNMTAPALSFDDKHLATDNLNLLRIRSKVKSAAIYNEKGVLFASYRSPGENGSLPRLPEADGIVIAGHTIDIYRRIVNNGTILGTVYLHASYEMTDRLFQYIGLAAIVSLFAVGIALVLMVHLGKLITRPILSIASISREVVEQRDYSRRAQKLSNDEVGDLVDAFNNMLDEIENRTRALEASNREIAREAEERQRAQQEVMLLNTDLERRVLERTVQLQRTNAELAFAKEEADKANQAKSAFLSSMSHELRTPLNAILGFSQLLMEETHPVPKEELWEFSGHIMKAGEHLLTLINEILNLAKIESGTLTMSLEPVALASVFQECEVMVEPMGRQHGIRLLFPKDVAQGVMADRTRLKQILLNLLSNAIKYNRESGSVLIACTPAAADRVRISVQDTGHGLPPHQVAALFQPFNRLDQETQGEEGTGIGLVVTKRLVELMGGEIGVNSTVGIGTVFWIDLPASTVAAETESSQLPALLPVDHANAPTLLYIEDNPANLKLVEEILRLRTNLRLLGAPDARIGIEMATAHQPNVILMDINLPGISGMEALRVLQATPRTMYIPVIALTANAMANDVDKGLQAGFFRYVTKPINVEALISAINSALTFAENGVMPHEV